MSQGWHPPGENAGNETQPLFPEETGRSAPPPRTATRTPTPVRTPSPLTDSPIVEQGAVVVEPGKTIFGKYVVERQLGAGGMGEVWLVEDVNLGVKRAVKLIKQGSSYDLDAWRRFRREARAMAQIDHPNAVTVHDSRLDQDDVAYIVMEYVKGQSLDKYLRKGQPMPPGWVAGLLDQLCAVLQVAHEHLIVHRDLKPSNLMLVDDALGRDRLKVLDFGIAKVVEVETDAGGGPGDESRSTIAGAFMGTPPYTSPEQAIGQAEYRSDLYSVGVILYELLTGSRPFIGPPVQLIADTLHKTPPPFAAANPEARVPAAVERVVMRCLEKSPEARPQSARELAREFRAAVEESRPGGFGRVLAGPVARRAAAVVVGLAVLVGLAVGTRNLLSGKPSKIETVDQSKPDPVKPPPPPVVPPPRLLPDTLEEKGRTYTHIGGGRYVPVGYEVADPKDRAPDGWPKVLVHRDGDTRVEFIRIPGDTFQMGPASGAPIELEHPVTVEGFYIQRNEVTNAEMEAYYQERQKRNADLEPLKAWRDAYEKVREVDSKAAPRHPAAPIPWQVADDFARARNAFLPTEPQWEYAARSGGKLRDTVWDDKANDRKLDPPANIDSVQDIKPFYTTAVGAYGETDRTEQGVEDMAGNVREWCREIWKEESGVLVPDRSDPPDTTNLYATALFRGGSWLRRPESTFVRSHGNQRLSETPGEDQGFRLVLECPDRRSAARPAAAPAP